MVSVWGSTWRRSCDGSSRAWDKLLIKPTGGPGRHSGGPGRQVGFRASVEPWMVLSQTRLPLAWPKGHRQGSPYAQGQGSGGDGHGDGGGLATMGPPPESGGTL